MSATKPADEERVRPCLECGSILPFGAEICSLCGERYAVDRIEEQAVKPCLACNAIIPARDLFCPDCGDFTLAVHVDRERLEPLGAGAGHAQQWAVHLLSAATLLVTFGLLVTAALALLG
jgi:RNA polymerase subunit RPABC4/transcription elongation factor Spt4